MKRSNRLSSWRLWLTLLVLAGFGSGSTLAQQSGAKPDRLLPIEIEADNLEVQQNKQLAIFAGNVNAIQGSYVLQAETLTVHYLAGQNKTSNGQAIERIDAIGQVYFSPEPETTAQGDEGVYDVVAGTITLTRRGDSNEGRECHSGPQAGHEPRYGIEHHRVWR